MSNVITTDSPLSAQQQDKLSALLDAIIPANQQKSLPSAKDLELVAYLNEQAADFIPLLIQGLDDLDDHFAQLTPTARHPVVERLGKTQAELFNGLLFHAFACYYQDDHVLEALGLGAGPPFPRGNEVVEGDMSLLDPVLKQPRLYRKVNGTGSPG
jgi:hypothetical protein